MIKITTTATTFRLNGKPYQKGAYELIIVGDSLGVTHISSHSFHVIEPTKYDQWRDSGDNPFASIQALIDYCELNFFLDGRVVFKTTANNYTALTTNFPTAPDGSLAYVYNSQGTAWLPGSLGGTYYANGVYLFVGGQWVSSRDAIAGQIQALIDAEMSLDSLKADKTDPRFPTTSQKDALAGTNGTPSSTNKYVTDSDPRNTNARAPTAHTHPATDIIPDSTHRFVTDAEKTTWNGKEDASNKETGAAPTDNVTKYPSSHTVFTALATKQNSLGFTPENVANKGVPNGYASLDASGLVPATQLPSYVDDVLEFANLAAFPAVGESGKIYVALDINKTYRWSGSAYIEISASPGSTDAVVEGVVNLYFTTARVLATLLSGISFATNSAILATDSILVAMGKLQAQITALNATAPTAGQKAALVGNNGTPGASNRYVTESGLAAAFTQSGNNVTRAINNAPATGFLVSATKYSYVRYTIAITCSVSLSGGQVGDAFVEIAPTGTAAGGTWTTIDNGGFSWSGTLVIGLTLNPTLRVSLAGFVPPNFDVRIRFAGTGTGAYVSGRESILN